MLGHMRPWVSALVFLFAGALLSWVGATQLYDAWPRSTKTTSGNVVQVDTRVVAGLAGRTQHYAFRLEGRKQQFELMSAILPHPTAGTLLDSGQVTIHYDGTMRVRENERSQGRCALERRTSGGVAAGDLTCPQYEVLYIVTGLEAGGRVYFTPTAYLVATIASALVVLVPGCAMLGLGALWLYRLRRDPQWRPRRRRMFGSRGGGLAVTRAAARDRRKTADGQWLH